MAKFLLTGGAGYIGSHTNLALTEAGHETVIFDNLSTGLRKLVIDGKLVVGDLLDKPAFDDVLKNGDFDMVIHFAARSKVSESVENPSLYWRNNVIGTRNLLDSMIEYGPRRIVFSSSAAVYGEPQEIPIPENHPLAPINPYGHTKLAIEWMIREESTAHDIDYGLLRYFNAAGADPEGRIGLSIPLWPQLLPVCMDAALGRRKAVRIFGDDYQTPDGTGIRDYVHVTDLAAAHIDAAKRLSSTKKSFILNLGAGKGYSVHEVIRAVEIETGTSLPIETGQRRIGDPAVSVADINLAREFLGWQPRLSDLDTIVRTSWKWHCKTFA